MVALSRRRPTRNDGGCRRWLVCLVVAVVIFLLVRENNDTHHLSNSLLTIRNDDRLSTTDDDKQEAEATQRMHGDAALAEALADAALADELAGYLAEDPAEDPAEDSTRDFAEAEDQEPVVSEEEKNQKKQENEIESIERKRADEENVRKKLDIMENPVADTETADETSITTLSETTSILSSSENTPILPSSDKTPIVSSSDKTPIVSSSDKGGGGGTIVVFDGTHDSYPPSWLWRPWQSQCGKANPTIRDPFPEMFEPHTYREKNEMKVKNKSKLDLIHYNLVGRRSGWIASRGQEMRQILNKLIIPNLPGNKLEIGPFLNPVIYGEGVRYFDVVDLNGLKERAKSIGYKSVREVEIDYVHPTGDLTSIPDKKSFSLILSSHVIEHQLDLVRHLNAVSKLLINGGYYTLFVPDKRFCFDHGVPATTVADVLDDYYNNKYQQGSHKIKSVIEHRTLTQHNAAFKHWREIHDPLYPPEYVDRLKIALQDYTIRSQRGEYIDVHNYQFTPQTLAYIIDTAHGMGLTKMRVHRVYETLLNKNEFVAVLQKCSDENVELKKVPPASGAELTYTIQKKHKWPMTWVWKPVDQVCDIGNFKFVGDPFPPIVDEALYSERNAEKVAPGTALNYEHFTLIGRNVGFVASRGQEMREILNTDIVPKLPGLKLEIGPFVNPLIHGRDDIKYFDMFDLDGLKERAAEDNVEIVREVPIDYVDPAGDLDSIPELGVFSLVVSAHVAQLQLDLVHHLNAISDLLMPGGYYVAVIPDKRYCFDYAIPQTTIADVLDDFYSKRYQSKSHKLKSVLAHRALTQHSIAYFHWSGVHDPPYVDATAQRIRLAVKEYQDNLEKNELLPVNNYAFTPQTFAQIVDVLHKMGLTPMRVHRVYETVLNQLEFNVVLKKCGKTHPAPDLFVDTQEKRNQESSK